MLTTLPLSMFYLSMVSCLALFLAFRIVKIRLDKHIGLGDGENEVLARQIRVQANLLKNILPFAILYILSEMNSPPVIFLHITGVVFLLSRLLHAYGFSHSSGTSFGRVYGTVGSLLTIGSLIAINLYQSIMIMIH